MNAFEVGDTVRLAPGHPYMTVAVGDEGEVIGVKDDNRGRLYEVQLTDKWGGKVALFFFEKWLELVKVGEDDLLPVGTRVRCTNGSMFRGLEGEITSNQNGERWPYTVRWEDSPEKDQGGTWSEDAFEVIDAPASEPEVDERDELIERLREENLALRAVATDASWVFRYFAASHINKNTPESDYKAMFNLMMADRLDDALETDS